MNQSKFAVAATSSGSGKTTLTLGMLRALSRRGLNVQPFKCGPDYIDTTFHSLAAGVESINLDLFMASEHHVRDLFRRHSAEKDVCVTEGVMGLYDGYNRTEGSTYHLAKLTGQPVVLLLDATSSAYSTAAIIHGFCTYRPDIRIAGVIFNRVTSPSHFSYLKQACEDNNTECFGYMKKHSALAAPSRHLGLTLTEASEMNSFIDRAADAVESGVNLDALLRHTACRAPEPPVKFPTMCYPLPGRNIAVARDASFNFIYPENIRAWEISGAHIFYFSPLEDPTLPKGADLLYFPGGYPEIYAERLAANKKMREAVKEYAENGGKILGECGGLIYLSHSIDGRSMCGIFPLRFSMEKASLTLGYRKIDLPGNAMRGHEFHYSHIVNPEECPSAMKVQTDKNDRRVDTAIYRYKNTIAGYTHLYWAERGLPDIWI